MLTQAVKCPIKTGMATPVESCSHTSRTYYPWPEPPAVGWHCGECHGDFGDDLSGPYLYDGSWTLAEYLDSVRRAFRRHQAERASLRMETAARGAA